MSGRVVPGEGVAYVIAGSHRSRDKLHRLVGAEGGEHAELFRFDRGYHITVIPAALLERALLIRNVRKAPRDAPEGWRKCWSFRP